MCLWLAAVIALALTAYAFVQTGLFLYDGVNAGQVQVPTTDQLPDVLRQALYMPLVCGLIVFGIAVALDLHDRERRTVWSDCAFWLHVVSAPMLVHPLFVMATGQSIAGAQIASGSDAVIGLVVLIAVFTYVALAIDRRSLLVPTLGYFGTLGVQNLVSDAATNAGIPPVALVLVSVGALVIMFGAGLATHPPCRGGFKPAAILAAATAAHSGLNSWVRSASGPSPKRTRRFLKRWVATPHWQEWWDAPDVAVAEILGHLESDSVEPMIAELGRQSGRLCSDL